jgi:serine/threonine-protein kinase
MAEVFLAVTSTSDMFSKLVVIKKPREHLADDAEFITMLVDEARIAARLNHPNLVQTIEVGQEAGRYFITMEYLDGQPLHRIQSRAKDTISIETFVSIFVDVLAGIHYAHELKDFDGTPLGIVHRDVTPHNIFVTYEGQVKVVDFGIAKAAGRASETRHGVVKGKTPYMAPEQAMGRVLDRRVDIFAVGVMLFEAAAKRRMWKGITETDIIGSLIAGNIPSSPREADPTVDEELDRICRKALSFSPEDRYQTAADFQRDLELYLHKKGPRPNAREIGGTVAQIFAEKRAATDKIIETQLAKWRSERPLTSLDMRSGFTKDSSSGDSSPSIESSAIEKMPPSSRQLSRASSPGLPREQAAPVSERAIAPAPAAEAPARPPLNPWVIVAAVGLAALTAGLMALGLSQHNNPDTPQPTTAPEVAKEFTVTLRATPAETRFSIDNGPLLENPFTGTFPGDRKEHIVRAIAAGHPPKQKSVSFDADLSMTFVF